MTLKDASSLIKGELGSVVKLTVFRPAERKKITFELTRDNIKIKHVPCCHEIDDDGIGYIRITKFSKNTAKDFSETLNDLKDQGMTGLVIDLRGNSGGLLSNAINILDKLTDRGVNLLTTRGRIDKYNNKERNSRRVPAISSEIPIYKFFLGNFFSGDLFHVIKKKIIHLQKFFHGFIRSRAAYFDVGNEFRTVDIERNFIRKIPGDMIADRNQQVCFAKAFFAEQV